jgi:catechol 2,3-dioxygenase-like lactoylglutathione lyase family enzyme
MLTPMDWKLEVIVIPVSDVDRAKEFYGDTLGFPVDNDHRAGENFRVVQVTPPGSACSIVFGTGVGEGEPGSIKGLQLVVDDIAEAHAHLESRGVGNSGLQHFVDGAMTPGPDPSGQAFGTFVFFGDPDGNSWAVQQGATS